MAAPGGVSAELAASVELPGRPLLVALSGGADSAALAWLAARHSSQMRAVHIHHGLAASDRLAAAAAAIARHLDVPLDIVDVVVPAGASVEAQARRVRREALEASAKPEEAILTGHTMDDQAETVLLRVLRGTGVAGLGAMHIQSGRWHRPLLELRRSEVRAVAAEQGLPFVDDPANADTAHRRTVVRHELLPLLERVHPGAVAALSRLADLARDDEALLDDLAGRVPIEPFRFGVKVPLAALAARPAPVARRALRRAAIAVDPPYPPDAATLGRMGAVADGDEAATALAGEWQVRREPPWLVIHTAAGLAAPVPLVAPGQTVTWAGTITASPGAPPYTPLSGHVAVVGAGALVGAHVRPARPGDRIVIAGGSKAVFSALAEQGVAPRARPHWPVVVSSGKIVWVVGGRVDPEAARDRQDGAMSLRAHLEEL